MALALEQIKILIADGDNALANKLSGYLRDSGFQTKVINNSYLVQRTIMEWRPHFIFIDLLFPGMYAQQVLKFLNERNMLGEDGCRVIVMSNHNAEINVMSCLQAGADDFLVKPLQFIEVLHRLSLLSQTKKFSFDPMIKSQNKQIQYYFEMIDLLIQATAQNKNDIALRFDLIKMLSIALKAVRTSIVEASDNKTKIKVTGSSDDPTVNNLDLELKKYPEFQYVLRTEKPLFIEALDKDKTMSFVQHKVKTIQFNSMIVLPLKHNGELKGALSIRMPKDRKKLSIWDIKLADIASQLIAITWKFENKTAAKKAA